MTQETKQYLDINLTPTPKQFEAYVALRNPDIDVVFLGGGAGGGKSWFICESRLANALAYPGYKSFIGRQELKRLMQSTYMTFLKVAKHHKIPEGTFKLNGQYNYIDFANGSRIDLLDLNFIPSDPMYERLGSTEYTDGSIEEAGEIHFLAYDVLKSRVGRHMNHEFGLRATLVVTGNPKKNWTKREFYDPFKEGKLPKNIAFVQSLYRDNPYTAEDYGKQLASIRDKVMKERLMYGNWDYSDDDNALMSSDAIADMFTNSITPSENKYFVADVARMGSDSSVFNHWKGFHLYKIEEFTKQGIDITSQKLTEAIKNEQIPRSHAIADEDGIGGGVVDAVRGIKGFMANRSPFPNRLTGKPDNYKNLKTQCAYLLADFVNDRKIRIECDDMKIQQRIIDELSTIKRKDSDKEGKLEIEPKEKQKEMLGHSPDFADCLIMRMYFELEQPTRETKTIDPITSLLSKPMERRGTDQLDFH